MRSGMEPEYKDSKREGLNNKDRKYWELAELRSCVGWCEWGSVTLTLSPSASWADLGREIVIFSKKSSKLHCNTPTSLHHHFMSLCFNCTVWKMTNTHKSAGLPNVLKETWHLQQADTNTNTECSLAGIYSYFIVNITVSFRGHIPAALSTRSDPLFLIL